MKEDDVLAAKPQKLPSIFWLTMLRNFTLFAFLAFAISTFLPMDRIAAVKANAASFPDLYEASIAELQEGLQKRQFTSVDLVKAYFARIEEVNLKGPVLRAVIETNPSALAQARALDLERSILGPRGPLHGIPILLKDNIATLHSEGM